MPSSITAPADLPSRQPLHLPAPGQEGIEVFCYDTRRPILMAAGRSAGTDLEVQILLAGGQFELIIRDAEGVIAREDVGNACGRALMRFNNANLILRTPEGRSEVYDAPMTLAR